MCLTQNCSADMPIDRNLIRQIFEQSMDAFLQKEVQALLEGVNERNNCARCSIYMQEIANNFGLGNYYADAEYNRKQNGQVKTILNGEMKVVQISCDLLLHSRGKMHEDNLIAVEMKKYETRDDDKRKDRERLCALTKVSYDDIWSNDGVTLPEHVCGYILGVFIEIDRNNRRCNFEYYENGNLFENKTRFF